MLKCTSIPEQVGVVLDAGRAAQYARGRGAAAQAQWAERPIEGGLVAVGDAAFACEPSAGQGVLFALHSASAAAAVLENLRDGVHVSAAEAYYRELVDGARRRHVFNTALAEASALTEHAVSRPPHGPLDPHVRLRFNAHLVPSGLRRDARVVPALAVRLRDGGLTRWVGGFDILALDELARTQPTTQALLTALVDRGLGERQACALLQWCEKEGVLCRLERPAPSREGPSTPHPTPASPPSPAHWS